jgi:hypothetical protein
MANKVAIKKAAVKKQNGKCNLSDNRLPVEIELQDTHRPKPKRKGGIYTSKNTTVVDPVAHMIEHGTLRLRTGELQTLKQLIDEREHAMRLLYKINNQLLAVKRRTDDASTSTINHLQNNLEVNTKWKNEVSKTLEKHIKQMAKNDPLITSCFSVRGIGPISIAYCIAYIDLEKARHASALWSYTGLHKASHERYEKNVAGGGNKRLRTVLYMMAESQMKLQGAYRSVYDNIKNRLEHSEKITKSRNTQGKLIECAWKDTKPCHRHGAALRAVMKHFLADYWYVGRKLSGLPVSPLYPEAVLGGNHRTIMPEERGWEY